MKAGLSLIMHILRVRQPSGYTDPAVPGLGPTAGGRLDRALLAKNLVGRSPVLAHFLVRLDPRGMRFVLAVGFE